MKKKRSQAKKEATYQKIIDAAKAIFPVKGYHETSVQDITEGAGIAHGTFYLYFKSKSEIFAHLVNLFLEEILNTLSLLNLGHINSFSDYESQLRQMTHTGAQFFSANPELSRILLWEAVASERRFSSLITDLLDQFTVLGQRYIEHGQALGFLRSDIDAHRGARIVVAAVWGIAYRWAARGIDLDTAIMDVEELIDELLYGTAVVHPPLDQAGKD